MRKFTTLLWLLAAPLLAAQTAAPYAVVNASGIVVNIVEWDGVSAYSAPVGDTLVSASGQPNAQIGATYSGGVFTAPATPAPPQGIIYTSSPTSGSTISLPCAPQPQAKLYAYLQPSAALASLTINLCTGPLDGDVLYLLSSKAITTLTLTAPAGTNFAGAPTTLAAGSSGAIQLTYSVQFGGWFQW
jgi:hypothetical protein